MPERSGHLHEISAEIGEIKGLMKALDRYTHEREHGLNNLSQKVDGLRISIGKDIAAVEARMEVRFEAFEKRIRDLEASRLEADTQKRTATSILQSPILGGIIGSVITWAALLFAWWKKSP